MLNNYINERWLPISGYENIYHVSDMGRVKNIQTGHIRKLQKQSNGKYYCVSLYKDNKEKRYLVHRLVAQAFLDNPNNLPQVNHKDKDVFNNNLSNLEWCCASENLLHAYRNGRKPAKAHLGKKTSTASKYRYVYWDKSRNKYKASIKYQGVTYNLGRFNNEENAALAANKFIINSNLPLTLNII